MTTIQLTDKQMENIEHNLGLAALILDGEPTPTERDLVGAYNDLCKTLAACVVADGTMIMVGKEEFVHDNMDRAERHNVAGSMNRPSKMQEEAFKEEHDG